MLLFSRFVVGFLPHPDTVYEFYLLRKDKFFPFVSHLEYLDYRRLYESALKEVVAFYRVQLLKLDKKFAFQEMSLDVVRRRNIALANGIGPLDVGYPSFLDINDILDYDFMEGYKKGEPAKSSSFHVRDKPFAQEILKNRRD